MLSVEGFSAVPPQVQVGVHTLDVIVKAIGDGKVSVSLKQPTMPRAEQTRHSKDDEDAILLTISTMLRDLRPQLDRDHKAEMTARGYRI